MRNNNSNLPPGCRECDIPGNRPEDAIFDKWWDKIDEMWKDYLTDEEDEDGTKELREKYGNDGGDAYESYIPFKQYADKILRDMNDPDYGRPDTYDD